jgi:hypothetical protein
MRQCVAEFREQYRKGVRTYGELMQCVANTIRTAELNCKADESIEDAGWEMAKKLWADHAPRK